MPDSSGSPELPLQFRLDGKLAVVTGATGILGSQYCQGFTAAGGRVVIADIDSAKCESLAAEINKSRPGSAFSMPVDLANEDSIVAWGEQITNSHGVVDIILNNAAAKSPNFFLPLDRFPLADWNQVMAVNITAMFLVVRALGPGMASRGKGSIINVSSIYGVVGPDQRIYEGSWYEALKCSINTPLVYSVSKGAVISLTKYLATYWGEKGIRSNTLTPGGVESGQNETFQKRYCARVPMGRMAHSNDMVNAAIFLASDASAYINGQNLIVDGGLTAW